MVKNKELLKKGLRPTPEDKRDFELSAVFGAVKELPDEDFVIGEPKIKNQRRTDFCTAYASCLVSEYQEGVELSPEYAFMKAKKAKGSWRSWGCDLRTLCKIHVKVGVIEQKDSPYIL
jgi:hypothetical protein|tara:strand:+ start:1315 stop:1668 length:354 start_codon:yes stop_codon:yes gene_type:complete